MHAIELKGITKTYSGSSRPAIRDVSLTVAEGSLATLLGPSGCGKTTMLRLIAGFEWQDSGSISLKGKVVSDFHRKIPPEKRNVGMVFQDYALFPHLNVLDNVGFGYKERDRKGRIEEVLDMVDLSGYEKRYPHQLSGGQQQRVALARALAPRPLLVLLDEPFSNLDADLRAHMRSEIRQILKETGTTAVFVSHDQKDALAISERIVVMREGAVQQEGTPQEIYQAPKNTFVATFVGTTNILTGRISPQGRTVETALGTLPCLQTHGLPPHREVFVSVRPESLELASNGPVQGKVKSYSYTGKTIDAVIAVQLRGGVFQDLSVHIHPEARVQKGDALSFRLLPDFVAVLEQ